MTSVSRPRRPMPAQEKQPAPSPKNSRKRLPEELARDAIAHEEVAPGDKVRMTFRVVLSRQRAEALAAQAIREEKNLVTLVTEILEGAGKRGR